MRVVRWIAVLLLIVLTASSADARPRRRKHRRPRRGTAGCPVARLVDGKELATSGPGWLIPKTWAKRGLNHGTPDLVGLIERTAARVAAEVPDSTLYVADLSPRRGGASMWHRSHGCGRDVDLIYFARDDRDRQVPPPNAMPIYDADGVPTPAEGETVALGTFDDERNWALVKALVLDRRARVTKVFISSKLRARLLAYATAHGEPASVVTLAAAMMTQPSDSLAHDDHMHVRITVDAPPKQVVAQGKRAAAGKARQATVVRRKAAPAKVTKTARPAKPVAARAGGSR